eukprot:TRINITY_DN17850_c1_g1_i1.p1 TRINITY_DN17850_c1_g1~~TRINITY_DN17850_c1_g1_i1.p1  ORF type:complete len:292 (-),score=64.12 TRINITY_DN17850_c1_g1_i1:184-1059(-)
MIGAVIAEGDLSWNTKANEVFDWWTKDEKDPRSRVTLHHIMSFTDGFVDIEGATMFTHDFVAQRCLTPGVANFYTPEECAKQIYDTAKYASKTQDQYMNATNPGAEPGTWFDYNSYHQNLAMSMAVKATGLDARDLMKKYLFEPAGMKNSFWLGGQNPAMSGFLQTTVDDYDRFLQAYAGYKIVPQHIANVLETNVLGGKNSTVQRFGTDVIAQTKFDMFAMGMMNMGDGSIQMGGNLGNVLNRTTGHYSLLVSSGKMPYQFEVLGQVMPFHAKVEEVWRNMAGAEDVYVI